MNTLSDQELLRDYAERRSEEAFAELARRHVAFVYSAALRMVRDTHLAEDVAQGVFVALARNARPLIGRSVLSGWLHRTTQNLAANAVRTDVRRRVREQEAAAMNESPSTETDATWEQIAPLLDTALGKLNETERDALLLRFFEQKSAREMAQILGTSEDAAQKRVSRAVEHLREIFAQNSVTVGAVVLLAAISANAIQTPPAGLTGAVVTGASTLSKSAGMAALQKTVIAAAAIVAVGAVMLTIHSQNSIRSLRQDQAALSGQVEQLTRERDEALKQAAVWQNENEGLRRNAKDIVRLRAEVARLRGKAPAAQPSNAAITNISKETPSNSTNPQVMLSATFVDMPSEDLQNLGIAWTPGLEGASKSLLTADQIKSVFDNLDQITDADMLRMPRVTTLNGMQSYLSQEEKKVSVGGVETNLGLGLNMIPYFSTNDWTFDLHVIAKYNHLTGGPSVGDTNVLMTQVLGRATLSGGQTAVFEKEMPEGGWLPDHTNATAGPRSMVVFVTPEPVDSAGNLLTQ